MSLCVAARLLPGSCQSATPQGRALRLRALRVSSPRRDYNLKTNADMLYARPSPTRDGSATPSRRPSRLLSQFFSRRGSGRSRRLHDGRDGSATVATVGLFPSLLPRSPRNRKLQHTGTQKMTASRLVAQIQQRLSSVTVRVTGVRSQFILSERFRSG